MTTVDVALAPLAEIELAAPQREPLEIQDAGRSKPSGAKISARDGLREIALRERTTQRCAGSVCDQTDCARSATHRHGRFLSARRFSDAEQGHPEQRAKSPARHHSSVGFSSMSD